MQHVSAQPPVLNRSNCLHVQVLLSGLGWPLEDPKIAPPPRPTSEDAADAQFAAAPELRLLLGRGLRSARDELKAQILTVQVVRGLLLKDRDSGILMLL